MIIFPCTHCGKTYRVMGDEEEVRTLVGPSSSEWPNFPCASCQANVVAVLEHELDPAAVVQMQVRDLTPVELFAAQSGMGLPEERSCTPRIVRETLTDKKIVRVVGNQIPGSEKFVLEELHFEDGTRMYFGASGYGAVVYRIVGKAVTENLGG